MDQKIAVFMLQDGEECAELLMGLAQTMTIVLEACHIDKITGADVSVLKGGLNACFQMVLANKYEKLQTVAIVAGLDKALLLANKPKPESMDKAIKGVLYDVVG